MGKTKTKNIQFYIIGLLLCLANLSSMNFLKQDGCFLVQNIHINLIIFLQINSTICIFSNNCMNGDVYEKMSKT